MGRQRRLLIVFFITIIIGFNFGGSNYVQCVNSYQPWKENQVKERKRDIEEGYQIVTRGWLKRFCILYEVWIFYRAAVLLNRNVPIPSYHYPHSQDSSDPLRKSSRCPSYKVSHPLNPNIIPIRNLSNRSILSYSDSTGRRPRSHTAAA